MEDASGPTSLKPVRWVGSPDEYTVGRQVGVDGGRIRMLSSIEWRAAFAPLVPCGGRLRKVNFISHVSSYWLDAQSLMAFRSCLLYLIWARPKPLSARTITQKKERRGTFILQPDIEYTTETLPKCPGGDSVAVAVGPCTNFRSWSLVI
ncbi:hypothetical protein Landi51_01556 [Colletotrichum acutatum]